MITIDIQQVCAKKRRHKSGRDEFRVQNDFAGYMKRSCIGA